MYTTTKNTWETSFWLDKAIMVSSPICVFLAMEQERTSDGRLGLIVWMVFGILGLFCQKLNSTWILQKWYEKTAYVLAIMATAFFAVGFLSAIV